MAFDTYKQEMWGVNIQLDQGTDDIKAKTMFATFMSSSKKG